MAKASTFFNEENMKVIRSIFKEEFGKQEKNIGNLISANFEITMEEIRKSQDEIKNKYVIDGDIERKGETWEQCKDEIQNIFKEKLSLENIDIERAHRLKGKTCSNIPRTVVCKLLSYK